MRIVDFLKNMPIETFQKNTDSLLKLLTSKKITLEQYNRRRLVIAKKINKFVLESGLSWGCVVEIWDWV